MPKQKKRSIAFYSDSGTVISHGDPDEVKALFPAQSEWNDVVRINEGNSVVVIVTGRFDDAKFLSCITDASSLLALFDEMVANASVSNGERATCGGCNYSVGACGNKTMACITHLTYVNPKLGGDCGHFKRKK